MITFKGSQWEKTPKFVPWLLMFLKVDLHNHGTVLFGMWLTVIDFIKFEWGKNDDLSDKYLTYKLAMLLAMTSASRVLGLQHLDIRFMAKGTNNYIFTFGNLHKSWRKEKPPSSRKVYTFEEDAKLCVVPTLEEYCNRTKVWKLGKDKSQLLLSFIKPRNLEVSTTISRWIENVLREVGIDTEIFNGHSTRLASTSKAGLGRLSVTDTLERGSWSNVSTWQRFYNRQVEPSAEEYQNNVLSQKLWKGREEWAQVWWRGLDRRIQLRFDRDFMK